MPTYLYWCEYHNEFEDFHSMSKIHKECPKCKEEEKTPGEFKQLINSTTKGRVDLVGQDLVDQVKADTKKLNKDIHSNEKAYANMLSPEKYHQMQTQLDRQKRDKY